MEKKKWYQSKIMILALGTIVTLGSNLIWNWAGTQLTPDEVAYIQQNAPAAADRVKQAVSTSDLFMALGAIGQFAIGLWRFNTSKPITL